jgi:hypothetical protein
VEDPQSGFVHVLAVAHCRQVCRAAVCNLPHAVPQWCICRWGPLLSISTMYLCVRWACENAGLVGKPHLLSEHFIESEA